MSDILDTLRTEIQAAAQRAGLTARACQDVADSVVERLRLTCGAERLYVPSDRRARKRAAVLAEFTGGNHDEVCRRHRISRRTLYRMIGRRPPPEK